jgi:LasA protease
MENLIDGYKKILKRRLLLPIILGSLIPALACNFPFSVPRSGSIDVLSQTLTAMSPVLPVDKTPVPVGADHQESSPLGEVPAETGSATRIPKPATPSLDESGQWYTYLANPGDILVAVAKRFAVEPDQIKASPPIYAEGLLPSGQELLIPNQIANVGYTEILLPDSEVINSPSAKDFQVHEFTNNANGYLSTYGEMVNGSWLSGADIVRKVAQENSINPQMLLAILEFRSGWVYSQKGDDSNPNFPIGFFAPEYKGLYYELVLTATHLGVGYYGWRSGERTSLTFPDGSMIRLNPGLNPGTVALLALFSKLSNQDEWRKSLYDADGIISLYEQMYGNPWVRAAQLGSLFPDSLAQPMLELPFSPGERWSFTGGPHRSWNSGSPRGAIDFSPVTGEPPCTTSRAWVTASADGVVTRANDNVLAVDLDGDGYEQTGWVLVYLHIAEPDSITPGSSVVVDQPLGHPSCERGNSTGTNVHIARKFNGEWIPVDGIVPFVLSGWEVHSGERSYQGELRKGEQTITANPGGPSSSLIIREE